MSKSIHPKDSASFLNNLCAVWLFQFFRKTSKALKNSKKLFDQPKSDNLGLSFKSLESEWALEKNKGNPSLSRVLIRVYGKQYLKTLVPLGMSMVFILCQSLLIGEFISFLFTEDSILKGYLLSVGITILSLVGTIQNDRMFLLAGELAIKIRSDCNQIVYQKILNISLMNLQDNKLSNIINLLNIDLGFFMQLCMTTYIFTAPLYFLIATFILYLKIGYAGIIVHFSMLLTIPVLFFILEKLDKYKSKIMIFTKQRMNWIDGLVQGIKIIKIFCWEQIIKEKVNESRKSEIKWYVKKSLLKVVSFTIVTSFQGMFILLTYFIKVRMGESLQLNDVFCGVCVLISSHFYITAGVSEGLIMMKLIWLSVRRVREVLLITEISEVQVSEKYQVYMDSVHASWSAYATNERSTEGLMSESGSFVLKDISLYINKGQFVGIIGPVGSGKSTFVNTLLGECNIFEGSFSKNCKISYYSQVPWIINSSIKDNILMGAEYNEERYQKVIEVCELAEDLQGMVKNDESKTGEEGKLLSQGQQVRIALARCVYKDSDLYLLDDPFAGLDLRVAENILKKCINTFLSQKTVVLVTNTIDFLPKTEQILFLSAGYIEFSGSLANLLENPESLDFIKNHLGLKNRRQKIKKELIFGAQGVKKKVPLRVSQVLNQTIVGKLNYNYRFGLLYRFMLGGFRSWHFLLIFLVLIGSLQFLYILHQYWISMWSSESRSDQSSSEYPVKLVVLTCIIIIGTLLRNWVLYLLVYISSKNLHDKAISAVLNSNLGVFYRSTPKEFIDSFSSDIFQIDENLTQAITFTIMFGIMIIGYATYIIYVIPWNAINIFVFILYSLCVLWYCVRPIVLLRQCFMLSNGPIINICKETINGISTIRSLDLKRYMMGRFRRKNEKMVKKFLNFFYFLRSYTCFISFGAAFLFSINFFLSLVLMNNSSPQLIAVGLSFNIGIMSILPWFFRLIIEIITLLPSLNRFNSFTNLLPESTHPLPNLTISKGQIEFENITMAYPHSREIVLSDLSFKIPPGQKFGIIGRSGSGKSSIFNALLKLSSPLSGKILIDNQDLSLYSNSSLRKQISFMSQNPFIFSGSVKFNIDPEGIYNDYDICRLLKTVGLGEFRLNHGLHKDVRLLDLSVGQKQLLALCRVLIKDCKVLLLDEVTANVDDETGKVIESLICEYSNGKTVLMIAHKLKLLLDYDLVMMIDSGCIVDILPPKMVLTREHTIIENMQ